MFFSRVFLVIKDSKLCGSGLNVGTFSESGSFFKKENWVDPDPAFKIGSDPG
jgi:hypothetical protein